MRRFVALALLLTPIVIASHDATAAPAGVIDLLTGFAAKESCSCAFVVGQSDAYCIKFGMQSAFAATITIDHTAKTVSASAVGLTRTAHLGANGCLLDLTP
jgi:hypothetical protein